MYVKLETDINTSFEGERRKSNLMGKSGSVGKWGICDEINLCNYISFPMIVLSPILFENR